MDKIIDKLQKDIQKFKIVSESNGNKYLGIIEEMENSLSKILMTEHFFKNKE